MNEAHLEVLTHDLRAVGHISKLEKTAWIELITVGSEEAGVSNWLGGRELFRH